MYFCLPLGALYVAPYLARLVIVFEEKSSERQTSLTIVIGVNREQAKFVTERTYKTFFFLITSQYSAELCSLKGILFIVINVSVVISKMYTRRISCSM